MIAWLILILLVAFSFAAALAPTLIKLSENSREMDRKARLDEAKIRLTEARIAQLPEQTRGITERYRMTQENRINAMIRQGKQELEIEKLQAQVELLRRALGTREPFDPQP